MIHELVRALVTATGAENAAIPDDAKISAHPAEWPNALRSWTVPRLLGEAATTLRRLAAGSTSRGGRCVIAVQANRWIVAPSTIANKLSRRRVHGGTVRRARCLSSWSKRCSPICGATATQILNMNDCRAEEFAPKKDNLLIEIEKWQVKGMDNKEKLLSRKKTMQSLFWEYLGLHVDKPKPGSGNTARRAFENPETLAEITGVDITVTMNIKIILLTISCRFPMKEKFERFCFQTAALYKENYPCYPMPPTLHKILIHGKQILQQSILPPGYLAEDAAESRNKLYRYDREFHARKNSRKNNLLDVFRRAMETSDPFISSKSLRNRRHNRYSRKPKLPSEVVSLLLSPYVDGPTAAETTEDEETEAIFPILKHLNNIELESVEML